MGPPLLHGLHCVIIYKNTGNDSHAKNDVPDAPFPAKMDNLVCGSAKYFLNTLPKRQQPLASPYLDSACSRSLYPYNNEDVGER